MRRMLPESVLEEVGKLDPAAIVQVREEAWPDVRDADELHDVLHTLVALPMNKIEGRETGVPDLPADQQLLSAREDARTPTGTLGWRLFFEQLHQAGRAVIASVAGARYWI